MSSRPGASALRGVTLGDVDLPVNPPVAPMLAVSAPEPPGDQIYEPKWDGFRALVFVDGEQVRIDSRNGRQMTRFFPEVVAAVRAELPDRCVVDGEIVLVDAAGVLDFAALQLRLHPAASRIAMLAGQTPATFVAFDLLALGEESLLEVPFSLRRARLAEALSSAREVRLTPATTDLNQARRWFVELEALGLDGIMAKRPEQAYVPGKRVMTKIKHRRTADCVVAGYREHKTGPDAVGSLLLALYDEDGDLVPVGTVGALSMTRRRDLVPELAPFVVGAAEHPWQWASAEPEVGRWGSRWNPGKSLAFVPLRPERVLQVRYDAFSGGRFRHLAQFDRWRDDRDPRSCGFDQLERPAAPGDGGLASFWTR